jgi:hypothetical protein
MRLDYVASNSKVCRAAAWLALDRHHEAVGQLKKAAACAAM